MKKFGLIVGLVLMGLPASWLFARFEQEQLDMETQLQQKIEGVLFKTLPANSYLVTVKVEMEDRGRPVSRKTTARRGGGPVSLQNQYVLPRVPQKKEFTPAPETN